MIEYKVQVAHPGSTNKTNSSPLNNVRPETATCRAAEPLRCREKGGRDELANQDKHTPIRGSMGSPSHQPTSPSSLIHHNPQDVPDPCREAIDD